MTILVQEFEQIPMILKVTHDFKGLSDLPIEVGVLGKMTFYRSPKHFDGRLPFIKKTVQCLPIGLKHSEIRVVSSLDNESESEQVVARITNLHPWVMDSIAARRRKKMSLKRVQKLIADEVDRE